MSEIIIVTLSKRGECCLEVFFFQVKDFVDWNLRVAGLRALRALGSGTKSSRPAPSLGAGMFR